MTDPTSRQRVPHKDKDCKVPDSYTKEVKRGLEPQKGLDTKTDGQMTVSSNGTLILTRLQKSNHKTKYDFLIKIILNA
jgi:hypothetical protein